MTERIAVTVPASPGDVELVEVEGVEVIVEKTPDNTPQGVPQIRFDTPGSAPIPAFNQARFRPDVGRFRRLYVEGRGGDAGTLYLTIITTNAAQYRISGAVE